MPEKLAKDDFATREEVVTALSSLTDDQMILLGKWARYYVRGIPLLDHEDLLHTAIVAVLNGGEKGKTRQWPKSINFLTFLSNVMKSIASSQRRSQISFLGKTVLLEDAEASLAVESHETEIIKFIEVEEELVFLRSLFKDDLEASTILEFMLNGASKIKILKETGMSEKRYDSARKRIRRKVENLNLRRTT